MLIVGPIKFNGENLYKGHFPPGEVFRPERQFLLFRDQLAESGYQKTKENIPGGKFCLVENGRKTCFISYKHRFFEPRPFVKAYLSGCQHHKVAENQLVRKLPNCLEGVFKVIWLFCSDEHKTSKQKKDQLNKFKRGSKTTGFI